MQRAIREQEEDGEGEAVIKRVPLELLDKVAQAIQMERLRIDKLGGAACRHDDAQAATKVVMQHVADHIRDLLDVDAMEMPASRRTALRELLTWLGDVNE